MGKKSNKKADPVTASFAFTFLDARETGVKAGKKVYIQWKRGEKKENHGQTEEIEVGKDGSAKFNKSVVLKATMLPDGDKYEAKYLSISLREGKDSVGKIIIDLGTLLVTCPSGKQSEPMSKKKAPFLDYMVAIEVLKVGARKVIPSVAGSGKDKMKIAGAEWDLDDESGSEEEMSMAGTDQEESGKEHKKRFSLLRRESSVKKEKDKSKDTEKDKEVSASTSTEEDSSSKRKSVTASSTAVDPYADVADFGDDPFASPSAVEEPKPREKISRRESSVRREKEKGKDKETSVAPDSADSSNSDKPREKVSRRESSMKKDKSDTVLATSSSSSIGEKRKSVTLDDTPVTIPDASSAAAAPHVERSHKRRSSQLTREEPAVSSEAPPQVSELQFEIQQLKKQLSKAQAAERSALDAVETLKQQQEADKQALDTEKKALESERLASNEAKSSAENLKLKIDEEISEKQNIQKMLQQAEEALARVDQEKKGLEGKIRSLETETSQVADAPASEQSQAITALRTELETQSKAHHNRITELETELSEIGKEKDVQAERANNLASELENLKQTNETTTSERASQVTQLIAQMDELKADLAFTKEALEKASTGSELATGNTAAEIEQLRATLEEKNKELEQAEQARDRWDQQERDLEKVKEQLTEDLEALQRQIKELETSKKQLAVDLEAANSAAEAASSESGGSKAENLKLQKKFEAEKTRADALQTQVDELHDEIDKEKRENVDAQHQLEMLKHSLATAESETQRSLVQAFAYESDVSRLTDQINDLESKLDAANRDHSEAQTELKSVKEELEYFKEKAQEDIQEAIKSKEAAEAANVTAQEIYDKLRETHSASQEDIQRAIQAKEAAESANVALQDTYEKLREDHNALQEEKDTAVKGRTKAESEIERLKARIASEAAAAGASTDMQVTQLKAQLEEQRTHHEEALSTVESTAAEEKKALEKDNKRLIKEAEKKAREHDSTIKEVERLTTEFDRLKQEYERTQTQHTEVVEALNAQLKTAEMELAAAKESYQTQVSALKTATEQIESLRDEADGLRKSLESSATAEDDAKISQIQSLRDELAESKKKARNDVEFLEQEIVQLRADIENLKTIAADAETTNKDLKGALEEAKSTEQYLKDQVDALEVELKCAKSALEKAQAESATAAATSSSDTDDLESLLSEKERLNEQVEMLKIELADMKQDYEDRLQSLEDKVVEAEKKSKRSLKERDADIADLTKQLKLAKSAAASKSGEDDEDETAEALAKAEAINTELQNQIEAKDEELQELSDESTKLKKDIKALKESLKQATSASITDGPSQEEYDRLADELEAIKSELQEEKLVRQQIEDSSNAEFANMAKKKKAKIARLKDQIATLQNGGTIQNSKIQPNGSDGEHEGDVEATREGNRNKLETALLARQRDELDLLISTVYAVREIASGATLESQLSTLINYLSDHNYFADDEVDDSLAVNRIPFLEKAAQAIQHQALVSQSIHSLFGWVGQIGLIREIVVEKHGPIDEDEANPASPATQAFVSAIEEATLVVYTALLNVAYNKLRPLCVPAFLSQRKPEMRKLLKILSDAVSHAQRIRVHDVVVEQVLCQIFYFINCSVFNKMLEDKNTFCTPTNSFEIKLTLSQLEEWTQIHIPKSGDKLKEQMAHTYEAATMLSMDKKLLVDDAELRSQIIPNLNAGQFYILVKNFKPDSIAPDRVSEATIKKLKQLADADGQDVQLSPDGRS